MSRLNRISAVASKISSNEERSSFGGSQDAIATVPQMHYEVPNLTSMLYEFTNREQEAISNAFRTGNYTSLRDLPNSIAPFNISSAVKEKM